MPQTKQQKQKNAIEMAEANALLSPQQKLAKLDKNLGSGVGAVRERARLNRLIEEAKAPKASAVTEANPTGKLSQEDKDAKKAATKAAKQALKQAA